MTNPIYVAQQKLRHTLQVEFGRKNLVDLDAKDFDEFFVAEDESSFDSPKLEFKRETEPRPDQDLINEMLVRELMTREECQQQASEAITALYAEIAHMKEQSFKDRELIAALAEGQRKSDQRLTRFEARTRKNHSNLRKDVTELKGFAKMVKPLINEFKALCGMRSPVK